MGYDWRSTEYLIAAKSLVYKCRTVRRRAGDIAFNVALIADLEDEPMVLLDSPPSKDYFLSLFDQVEWQPKVAHTSASFEMVRGMVGHGLGYSLLATKPASGMTYDGKALAARPLTDVLAQSKVVLAKKAGVQLSPEAQAFADFCRGSFAG